MKLYKAFLRYIFLGLSMIQAQDQSTHQQQAIFAGGCFWCMEATFENVPGVIRVTAGYTNGTTANPNYKNYAQGGHVEAIKVTYDSSKVSYKQLLDLFWRTINPTDPYGQFTDRGPNYKTAIFYATPQEKILAEQSKKALAESKKFNRPVATEILPAQPFYKAEEYHQNYARKNPIRYNYFKFRSGRDTFFKRYWQNK